MDLEATAPFAAVFFNAMPDLSHPLDELIGEGDRQPKAVAAIMAKAANGVALPTR